ncbi:MAG: divergent PAP2 family protein [Candidatus Nomurabacteria bacterium]|nr:divergent PAP2 family protein [Candidatus Nomurabacteria bacterium]
MEGIIGIIAFTLGWLLAQLGKCLGVINQKGKHLKPRDILSALSKSGGMPSGHTASFVALDTYFGMSLGFASPIFALAICTTLIFIYDAINVRYAVGEQGKVLNSIVSADSRKGKSLRVVEGHTILQVIIGGIVGIAAGLACFIIFK